LESTQNINPKGYNNSNNEINPIHHFNYCRKFTLPKLANLYPHARKYLRVPLELGITPFQLIEFQMCIFE
jgi:hypothetical protein